MSTLPAKAPTPQSHHRYLSDDDEHERYAPVGIDGLLGATEKLLAVNRGLADPDDRDSLPNDRIYTPDRLMAERVKLDHGKTLRTLMGRLSRTKTLRPMGADAFAPYTVGYITSNPLVPALEEINPYHITEQKRRITKMGPGGIGDPNAITSAMQCHSDDTEVFTASGWKHWPKVTAADKLACRVGGRLEFHLPSALHAGRYVGPMHRIETDRLGLLVTPTHRFFSSCDGRTPESGYKWETAEQQVGKKRTYPCCAAPYQGSDSGDHFEFSKPKRKLRGYRLVEHGPIAMGDWCEYLGWYMAEGSHYDGGTTNRYTVTITQSPTANPEKSARIKALLERLPFNFVVSAGKNYRVQSRALFEYVEQFGYCGDKFIPDFLFEVKPDYRRRFLDAFLNGDGWTQKSGGGVYSSSSERLVDGLERLLISMGTSVTRGNPWRAKKRDGSAACWMHRTSELTSRTAGVKPSDRSVVDYDGLVYCATVPGSLLLTRRGHCKKPVWTGNSVHGSQFGFIDPIAGPESERAGIDVRLALGARIGSDGRVYQLMRNRSTGKKEWVSPSMLKGKTVKLPD